MANSRGGWQNLHKEHTFTTVSGTPDYALPSDFEYFVQRTFWDGNMLWELVWPITAQEKQILRYGSVTSGYEESFIFVKIEYLDPEPTTTGDTIAYDYYSNAWCQSSGGTAQQRWRRIQIHTNLMKIALYKNEMAFFALRVWIILKRKSI